MRKIIITFILAIAIYFNPSFLQQSKANSIDPQKECLNLVLEQLDNNDVVKAAKICEGSNKYTLKCMNRIIDYFEYAPVKDWIKSANSCKGASFGTSVCTSLFSSSGYRIYHASRLCSNKENSFVLLVQMYFSG